ncbi:hypothetical protein RJI07_00520 [Mycoplasmatota bacterium WC30]
MNNLSLHILSPNKNTKRFFGVDYFMNILSGHNNTFKYYSTSLDANPVYKPGPITILEEKYQFLENELASKEKGSIIGLLANPDIYQGVDSLKVIIDILTKYEMGLYLETTSEKIIEDFELLEKFSENHSLLIAVPCATNSINSKLFGSELHIDKTVKILQKAKNYKLNVGLIVKPIIPFINDNTTNFKALIEKAISAGVNFIYPSFSLKFDSKKLKEFYDVIDIEFPELMNKYHDLYGHKTTWESQNISELKKNFVIICRKNKVLYAMKDIINLYKPDLNIQLKLF